jgi:hypothetical protein
VTVVPAAAVTTGKPIARSHVQVRRAELDRHARASPTPPLAAIAPPRPVAPHAARDDRGPQRQFDPGPRSPDVPRAERRDERRQEVRTQPSPSVAATPSTPPAPATPPRASDPPRPVVVERPQARGNERSSDAPRRVAETRPDPRNEPQRAGPRFEPPRSIRRQRRHLPDPAQPRTEPRWRPRGRAAARCNVGSPRARLRRRPNRLHPKCEANRVRRTPGRSHDKRSVALSRRALLRRWRRRPNRRCGTSRGRRSGASSRRA